MNYDDLIKTVSHIVENNNIYKKGLTLVYELDEITHEQMNKILFYKLNPLSLTPPQTDEFEAEIGGVIIKFIKSK